VDIYINEQPHPVPQRVTVAQLLIDLGLANRHVAVEVNRELVPRAQHAEHVLADGDRVEIVTLVGGG